MKRKADALRKWRRGKGWTRAKLAEELGTTETSIYRWETGRHPVPAWVPKFLAQFDNQNIRDEREVIIINLASGESWAYAVSQAQKMGENLAVFSWPDRDILVRKDPDTGSYQPA